MDDLISLRIDAAEKQRLTQLARDRGMTLSDALRTGAARLLEDEMDPTTAAIVAEACGSTTLDLGARDETWDANAAEGAMDGAEQMQRFHFWHNDGEDMMLRSSYKLPFGTPEGGDHAVWRGVTAGAARLGQTQGVDEAAVRSKMEAYYRKAADTYQDDTISPPWSEAAVAPSEAFAADLAASGLQWVALPDLDHLGTYQMLASAEAALTVERVTATLLHDEAEAEKRPHVQPVRAAAEPDASGGWKANPLFFLDQPTRDGRILASPKAAGKVDSAFRGPFWTETPKTLMAQVVNPETGGHAGAFVAGTLPGVDISLKGAKVLASGRFNSDESGQQAQEYVQNGSLTGISVDLAPQKWQIEINPADGDPMMLFLAKGEVVPSAQSAPLILQESVDDVILRFLDYEVIGATLVPTPAFGDAQVALTADGGKVLVPQPGVGGVWVELGTNDAGWPIPRRVVVGGMVEAWDEAPPMLASSLRPQSMDGLDRLITMLDNARVAQLVSMVEARSIFANAIRDHA